MAVAGGLGAIETIGIEGPLVESENSYIAPDRILMRDLELGFDLNRTFDLVISIEVAEHLSSPSGERFATSACTRLDLFLLPLFRSNPEPAILIASFLIIGHGFSPNMIINRSTSFGPRSGTIAPSIYGFGRICWPSVQLTLSKNLVGMQGGRNVAPIIHRTSRIVYRTFSSGAPRHCKRGSIRLTRTGREPADAERCYKDILQRQPTTSSYIYSGHCASNKAIREGSSTDQAGCRADSAGRRRSQQPRECAAGPEASRGSAGELRQGDRAEASSLEAHNNRGNALLDFSNVRRKRWPATTRRSR